MQLKVVRLIKKKKNQSCLDKMIYDSNIIRYYNGYKIGHYANNYLKHKN